MKLRSYKTGRDVSRWLGAVEALGASATFKLLFHGYSGIDRSEFFKVRVPDLAEPVTIRRRSTDINVFMQIFAMNEYDIAMFEQSAAVFERYESLVASGRRPLIIDCGANSGMATLWWRKLFPQADIVAIEAASDNFAALQANTRQDPATKCIHAAVWGHKTELQLDNPSDDAWAFRFSEDSSAPRQSGGQRVGTVTIPEILEREDAYDRLLVVKIDIEGAERELFAENTGWIRNASLLVIETHDSLQPRAKTSINFFRALAKHDFEMCFFGENAFAYISDPVSNASSRAA